MGRGPETKEMESGTVSPSMYLSKLLVIRSRDSIFWRNCHLVLDSDNISLSKRAEKLDKALLIEKHGNALRIFPNARCYKKMHISSHFLGYSSYLQEPNKRYGNSISVPIAIIRNPF